MMTKRRATELALKTLGERKGRSTMCRQILVGLGQEDSALEIFKRGWRAEEEGRRLSKLKSKNKNRPTITGLSTLSLQTSL